MKIQAGKVKQGPTSWTALVGPQHRFRVSAANPNEDLSDDNGEVVG